MQDLVLVMMLSLWSAACRPYDKIRFFLTITRRSAQLVGLWGRGDGTAAAGRGAGRGGTTLTTTARYDMDSRTDCHEPIPCVACGGVTRATGGGRQAAAAAAA